jgi:hypothetical protein
MRRKTTIAAALLVLAVATFAAPAVAQETPNDNATYYDGESTETGESSWLSGLTDATLDDVLTLAMRLGTYVIGGGVTAQGGVGSAGALLTGLLVSGVMAGVGIRSGAGTSGGLIVGIASAFLFLTVGVGATWAYPVVLFVVGLIVATVFLRLVR